MSAPSFPSRSARRSALFRIPCACSLVAILTLPCAVAAQDQALVDAVAGVLKTEDERVFDTAILTEAVRHPNPIVRRRAALAIGRIGDPAGTTLLLELLDDQAAVVRQDAAFGLGLLADPSGFDRLRELILSSSPDALDQTHSEAVTALAKLGGGERKAFFEELLGRWAGRALAGEEPPSTVVQALREAWRLGADAPIELIAQYTDVAAEGPRLAAVYSLARLRAPGASSVFMRAVDDGNALIRSLAVRVLTAGFADSAGLDRAGTARWVVPLVDDSDRHVRTNAIRTLGTYGDPRFAGSVANHLSDSDPNVRVQALATLAELRDPGSATLLLERARRGPMAERRHAVQGLARVARDEAVVIAAGWITDDDWFTRAAGASALGAIGGDTAVAWLEGLLRDRDGRVVAQAFAVLGQLDSTRANRWARELLLHSDPAARALAARRVRRGPHATDAEPLMAAYELALRDSISDARTAVVAALGAVAELGFAERIAIEEGFLQKFPAPKDYVVRREAVETFPAAAAQWGVLTPVETGRSLEDYRDVARRLVLPAELEAHLPELLIDTEKGRITVSLFAAEAPLTVDALLRLAERNYFDSGAWHRVVPNFVIQGGDPRRDGWGGPGFHLRDENSRRRYGRGTMGMALMGPDTGGSQFFITHSPQPHLDGTYPVVGQVTAGMDVVDRIVQGDRIRTIRRNR